MQHKGTGVPFPEHTLVMNDINGNPTTYKVWGMIPKTAIQDYTTLWKAFNDNIANYKKPIAFFEIGDYRFGSGTTACSKHLLNCNMPALITLAPV